MQRFSSHPKKGGIQNKVFAMVLGAPSMGMHLNTFSLKMFEPPEVPGLFLEGIRKPGQGPHVCNVFEDV